MSLFLLYPLCCQQSTSVLMISLAVDSETEAENISPHATRRWNMKGIIKGCVKNRPSVSTLLFTIRDISRPNDLSCKYLNPHVKLNLIELAVKFYNYTKNSEIKSIVEFFRASECERPNHILRASSQKEFVCLPSNLDSSYFNI